MKIEEGKFYKTRDGRKAGPIIPNQELNDPWPWKTTIEGEFVAFSNNGKAVGTYLHDGMKPHLDIISEWADEGTVRTVTRREIVPGMYGILIVYEDMSCIVNQGDASELRAAAATLIEIADALDEQQ